nr:YigZ family protein [Bombilactobacillus thymidiniphilus]
MTIKKNDTHELIIKKSRFVTTLKRIQALEQAQDLIQSIKKENSRANHNCVAYLLGENNEIQHAGDDGEPSQTAGVPMLETLQQMQVQNVLAVTSRYFGGIKLGSSGLIRAYRQSVIQAIHYCGLVQGVMQQQIFFDVDYKQWNNLEYWLQQQPVDITEVKYQAKISVSLLIDQPLITSFITNLNNQLKQETTIKIGEIVFNEIEYFPNKKDD